MEAPGGGGIQQRQRRIPQLGGAVLEPRDDPLGIVVGLQERDPESPVSIVGGGRFAGEAAASEAFPLTEKIEVNGDNQHPLYQELTKEADAEGHTGDIRWNFEKFLIGRDGEIVARFSPVVVPEAAEVTEAIESALAAQ